MTVKARGAQTVAWQELGPAETGRDAVLARVFVAHGLELVGLAQLLVDERGQAEEIVQEAFIRAYAGWWRVRARSNPLPYLRRVVVNLARGQLRSRRLQRLVPRERVAPAPSAEAATEARCRDDVVDGAVRGLSRRQRECIALRYYLDCSLDETATTLGISVGAVKQHLHRALGALAIRLGEVDR
jgi:RNA polymerase sigma-70 factor (sigma-E family)